MASQELVKTLDYILNRCNERELEAVNAAILRRRQDIAAFGGMPLPPDPRRLAAEMSSQLNIEGSIESLKSSIREFAIRTIRQEAPELTDAQIEELTKAWIPDRAGASKSARKSSGKSLPHDILASMVDQFVSFSLGRMEEEENLALRNEMGPWPDKYWNSFPQVIRLLITDFLKDKIDEGEFNTRMGLALKMR